jgi:hypothetical protein
MYQGHVVWGRAMAYVQGLEQHDFTGSMHLSLSALHIRKARRPDYFVSRNEVFFSTESDMDTCSVLLVL